MAKTNTDTKLIIDEMQTQSFARRCLFVSNVDNLMHSSTLELFAYVISMSAVLPFTASVCLSLCKTLSSREEEVKG